MTKQELASYMSDLLSIMDAKEDVGIHRGRTIGWEYERHYAMMLEMIRKEKADEAGKRTDDPKWAEKGAPRPFDESSWGGPARPEDWPRKGV